MQLWRNLEECLYKLELELFKAIKVLMIPLINKNRLLLTFPLAEYLTQDSSLKTHCTQQPP